jgi:aminoglycoside phosphotransferase (APT) family kinase protein
MQKLEQSDETPPAQLDAASCLALVREHGLTTSDDATVDVLAGGVSNLVIAVTDTNRRVVVKQSLERLRVTDEWHAPKERILTEAEALRLTATLTPDRVPRPLFVDPKRFVLALEGAPTSWRDWRTSLMAGNADLAIASTLGATLATWHTATLGGGLLADGFFDPRPFELLRVDPYYRTVALRMPQVAEPLDELIEAMRARRQCLVHGDFSPKNVLVGPHPAQCWVIDFEVAHFGDPSFDVAFMLSHLTLKALHRPNDSAGYDACAQAFCTTYQNHVRGELIPDWPYILRHTAGLLLARVVGKSPATYLDRAQASTAQQLGLAILNQHPAALDDLTNLRANLGGP